MLLPLRRKMLVKRNDYFTVRRFCEVCAQNYMAKCNKVFLSNYKIYLNKFGVKLKVTLWRSNQKCKYHSSSYCFTDNEDGTQKKMRIFSLAKIFPALHSI
ncbi:hypothetical protein XENOCAPTIV_022076 [Xenoophorus captivus]|uniref:Uncharacterized protein n=1 Tax=Xenoophorus captivus TaxID=1517983 RepID=A0ABV0QE13_9TELE